MIKDLIELPAEKWKPRRVTDQAVILSEIHKEAAAVLAKEERSARHHFPLPGRQRRHPRAFPSPRKEIRPPLRPLLANRLWTNVSLCPVLPTVSGWFTNIEPDIHVHMLEDAWQA